MPQWVNFKEIRERVSLEDVLFRFYTIEGLTRHGSKLIGPCPVHGGDSPRAFHAELERNVWHCFSQCKGGGNQLDFVAKREGISIREAALRLQEFFLSNERTASAPEGQTSRTARVRDDHAPATHRTTTRQHHGVASTREAKATAPPTEDASEGQPSDDLGEADGKPGPPAKNPLITVKLNLKHEHPHLMEDRGLTLETLQHFGVGYCSRGIMRGTVAFPIHNQDGGLIAYAGRRLKPSDIEKWGKYKLPKGFRKELVLYNLHRCREAIAQQGVVLVEGFFTVLKLYQAGIENVVASMGCELPDAQAELLAEARDVIVLFDGNEAGWSGAEAAKTKLDELGVTVRLAMLPEGAEPDDLSPRALRWLINGMTQLDLPRVSLWARVSEPSAAE